jgi:hypothetical protein
MEGLDARLRYDDGLMKEVSLRYGMETTIGVAVRLMPVEISTVASREGISAGLKAAGDYADTACQNETVPLIYAEPLPTSASSCEVDVEGAVRAARLGDAALVLQEVGEHFGSESPELAAFGDVVWSQTFTEEGMEAGILEARPTIAKVCD